MKKAMIALAGVLSVMLLASCTKEVEIDGDVDKTDVTNQSYEYMLKAEGTVKWTEKDYSSSEPKDVEKSVSITSGKLSWDTDAATSGNEKKYWLEKVEWKASDDTVSFYWPIYFIVKYNNKYYANSSTDTNKIEITNPESSSFSVKGTYKGSDDYDKTYTFDVTFKR